LSIGYTDSCVSTTNLRIDIDRKVHLQQRILDRKGTVDRKGPISGLECRNNSRK